MPPTTPAPAPAFRPAQRPVPPAAQKNTGLLAGLGISAALAVIGLGMAGMLWSGKSSQQAINAGHQLAAQGLATTLNLTLAASTNVPVVWTSAWASITKAVTDQKTQLTELTTKVAATDLQVTDLQTQLTELADAKTRADKQTTLAKQSADELAALKSSTQTQIAALTKELADAKTALAEAQAQAAQASTATTEAGAEAPAAETAAPATAAATPPEAAPAMPAAVEASALQEPEAKGGSHTFAEGTTKLIKKVSYDTEAKTLKVKLANDTQLAYRNVPGTLYESLVGAPVPDTFFRMKLVGNYPCTPDDKAALRTLSAH